MSPTRHCKTISVDRNIYGRSFDATEKEDRRIDPRAMFFLPPTDVPRYIDVCFEESNSRFIIEFIYTIPEKQEYLFANKTAKFSIGQDSGKPFRLEINNVKRKNPQCLKEFIFRNISESILKNISKPDINIRQKANLEKTEELFRKKIDEMISVTI